MPVVHTAALALAYEERYAEAGDEPLLFLHGFPDDARTWDAVLARPELAGRRVLVPYLRGFGPTRFASPHVARTGEAAALARDALDLLDALGIARCTIVGHDWGARAAYGAAVLAPERFSRVVALAVGYGTNVPGQRLCYEQIEQYFYQWFFGTPRGEAVLRDDAAGFCRYLWRRWSPGWSFGHDEYARTAASFANDDFVDVVLHSYRHRWGFAAGDPAYRKDAARLATLPSIVVPTVVLHGTQDGATLPDASDVACSLFPAGYERRLLPAVGHFVQREAPGAVAAVLASG